MKVLSPIQGIVIFIAQVILTHVGNAIGDFSHSDLDTGEWAWIHPFIGFKRPDKNHAILYGWFLEMIDIKTTGLIFRRQIHGSKPVGREIAFLSILRQAVERIIKTAIDRSTQIDQRVPNTFMVGDLINIITTESEITI